MDRKYKLKLSTKLKLYILGLICIKIRKGHHFCIVDLLEPYWKVCRYCGKVNVDKEEYVQHKIMLRNTYIYKEDVPYLMNRAKY